MSNEPVRIGVIGGSGLYKMPQLTDVEEHQVDTPFGPPSDAIITGKLEGTRVAFLPRHGRGHTLLPGEVPYRANIYALKSLGVERIISVSACGSLREDYAPGHIVIPDQLYDNTKDKRGRSFFGDGLVAHIGVADPFCPELSQALAESVEETGATVHRGGAFVTIEGPRFSTKAESNVYRQWGMSLIGMTTSPEAFLAREAEMCYAVMAHVTDYDVWHESEEPVSVDVVIQTFQANLEIAQQAVANTVAKLAQTTARTCDCQNALAVAILTDRRKIKPEMIERLKPIVGKYLG
jgi:5'-methylthioadenosine phosphorylase